MHAPPSTDATPDHAGRHGDALGIEWLLAPVSREEFVQTHLEVRPLLVRRNDPSRYAALPGTRDVDGLIALTSGRDPASEGRLVRTEADGSSTHRPFTAGANGIPDLNAIFRAYDDGYSVVLNRLHFRHPAVARLCRSLEAGFHHPVGANLYLTPRRAQGFGPHADTHDVFVLQLAGVKEWHVSPPVTALPLASGTRPELPDLIDPVRHELAPGDLLYLPRGFGHRAVTSTEPSLHLTVGVHSFTWLDLMGEVLRDLAADEVALRRGLPFGFLDRGTDEHHDEVLDRLVAGLGDRSRLRAAAAELGARVMRSGAVTSDGHFRSLDRLPGLGPDSVVGRAQPGPCRVSVADGRARIDFVSDHVAGPASIEPLLRHMVAHPTFVVRDLPGDLPDPDRVDLVSRLVSEGFLQLIQEGTR